MPTQPKPFKVLMTEKKSHRTKAELEARKKAEEELATGVELKERPEVRNDPVAHKEFKRIAKLLKNIQKNDGLFEGVINRYCVLYSECKDFEHKREEFARRANELEMKEHEILDNEEMSVKEFYSLVATMQSQIVSIDKAIQSKRKMMLDIEKDNIMTIASGLRSIPKKEPKSESNELAELLRNG